MRTAEGPDRAQAAVCLSPAPAKDWGPTVRGLLLSDKSDVYGWVASTPFAQEGDAPRLA